jgi:hypothetical protein
MSLMIYAMLFLFFMIFVVPILWVLFSRRSYGGSKFGWLIVVSLFSWLGLAVFLIATQSPKNKVDDKIEPH